MNKQAFWSVNNVSEFNGHEVVNGEVTMDDSQYVDTLNDIYGDVEICGQSFGQGDALLELDPTAFRMGKGEEEDRLQRELEDQLNREDSDGIEFIDGDEWELDEEEDEDEE